MLSKLSDSLLELYVRADTPKPGPAEQPPGFDSAETILGWVKWCSLAVLLAGLMVVGARFAASKRGDNDEPVQVGKILIGVILVGAAGSLVATLAGG